jgi:hypothetical protein
MAFTLYNNDPTNPPRREVSFDDLDNKGFWCKLGEQKEQAFVKVMEKIGSKYKVQIHPEKDKNAYHPDLLVDVNGSLFVGEAKIKNSPLFFGRRYGVDPQYALTMDLKDSFNYTRLLDEGIDLLIFIWVKWEAHEMNAGGHTYTVKPMRGIWVTHFSKLRALETGDRPPAIHWYNASFRQPPLYKVGQESEWTRLLADFEPRLRQEDGIVKNITSNGYMISEGVSYPAGQSSGSYVFNLSDKSIFEEIYYKSC